MKILKEYTFLFIFLILLISCLFIDFIDGEFFFASGDTLSPVAIKNSIKFYMDVFNEFPF